MNKCRQVFANEVDFVKFYPMIAAKDAHLALTRLFHEVGVPSLVISDGGKNLLEGEFARKVRRAGYNIKGTEAYTQRQNRAEGAWHEVKRDIGVLYVPPTPPPTCLTTPCNCKLRSGHILRSIFTH